MVKITLGGVTTEVPEGEVDWYKRNGWKVVEAESIPEPSMPIEESDEAPAKKRPAKKE